jgi:radical SAM protein with 4Fe4S-binding SPASM domain
MMIISRGDDRVKKVIGEQKYIHNRYVKSIYAYIMSEGEDYVVYNLFTKEILRLSGDEVSSFFLSDYAIKNWFAVPSNECEWQLVENVREILYLFDCNIKNHKSYKYTIFTTMDCNAHCSYCFEKKLRKKEYMSLEKAQVICEYIINKTPHKPVYITWFGGEPLLNTEVIDYISEKLTSSGIEFHSNMFTNAYLFDEMKIARAKKMWKVECVEITLDGTESTYNQVKGIQPTDGVSPYKRVIENIKILLDNEIKVVVRLNVSDNNKNELLCLIDSIMYLFDVYKNIETHIEKVYQKIAGETTCHTPAVLESSYLDIVKYCVDRKIYSPTMHTIERMKTSNCYADRYEGLIMYPNGNLGICEHYPNKFIIGNIDNFEIDTDMIDVFRERYQIMEKCKMCMFLPDCIRMKNCDFHFEECIDEYINTRKYFMLIKLQEVLRKE